LIDRMEAAGFATSDKPVDVVRRQYLASAHGDLEALRATLADDVEWTEMAGFPLAGTYRTPEGVTSAVMERLGADWDNWIAHDDTYVADGENVLVLARYTATNKATGKDIDVRVAHHFIVRGGRASARGGSPRSDRRRVSTTATRTR
jgi:ketosteroid isomerase-like protein